MMTNEEWLKEQCNRYVNGECHTRTCLVRGGWQPSDRIDNRVDYGLATCHAHEILLRLEKQDLS